MASSEHQLDAIDLQILNLLQANARVSQAEMARVVGLAPSAILERLRKLEHRGVLKGYVALIDPSAADVRQLAFVAVRTRGPIEITNAAGVALTTLPEVLEVHHVAGEDCYLVKLRARDAQHVGQLLRQMQTFPGVVSTRTTIVLDTLKETLRLPLPKPHDATAHEVMSQDATHATGGHVPQEGAA
jgi:Lrp/AsnC family transcriptional regulator, leucine-responsive regulatory protein